jgi:hypothetical protein
MLTCAYDWCKTPWNGVSDHCANCGTATFKDKTAGILVACPLSSGWGLNKDSRTQKGKGVRLLQSMGYRVPTLRGFATTEDELKPFFIKDEARYFARPCPARPRHGFVDSRIITSFDEAKQVLAETLAADEGGELMLMSPIDDARWSAIWNPALLTIGLGNDGATAGKDTVSIPLVRANVFKKANLDKAAIGEDEDPYVEIVAKEEEGLSAETIYYTQLRAGVRVGKVSRNYLPSTFTVKEIIPTCKKDGEDLTLLEWETLMREKAGGEGMVVYHPGGSLTDHFTVHARTYGIPVVLEEKDILIGSIIEKESDDVIPDPKAVLKGLIAGEQMKIEIPSNGGRSNTQGLVSLLLTALYNSSVMDQDYSRWIGVSAALMLRFGSSALAGEARHIDKKRIDPKTGIQLPMKMREAVYNNNFPFTLNRHRARCNRLTNVLRYGFEKGGIGGEKWAKCGASLMPLYNAVGLLSREPTVDNVNALIRALNISVDQAHNNGWWLNKFTSDSGCYGGVQSGSIIYIVPCCGAALEAENIYRSLDEKFIEKRIAQWAGWSPLSFKPIKVKNADIISIPGLGAMTIQFGSRTLGPVKKTLSVDTEKITKQLTSLIGGFYIVPGQNGMKVEVRQKGQSPITIWEEPPLL